MTAQPLYDGVALLQAQNRRFRIALEKIKALGEHGTPPDYTEWVTFHDKVAQIADEALNPKPKE